MLPLKEPVQPKVHAASLSAGIGGYSIGKGVAVLVMHYIVGASPPEVKFAIEFLIESACTVLAGYVGGYMKSE